MSANLTAFLQQNNIAHELLSFPEATDHKQCAQGLSIPLSQVVRTVIISLADEPILVAVAENSVLDYESLETYLNATTKVFAADLYPKVLDDMAGGTYPMPLGKRYNMRLLLDESLAQHETLFFPTGDQGKLVRISREDLLALQKKSDSVALATSLEELKKERGGAAQQFKRRRIIELLDNVEGLPAMPEMALRIIEVSSNPNSDANHLGKVIEVDPSLSAQIMSYANSAFYSYRGKIASVREAIARVLGFEMVANLAIGIAMGKSFSIPSQGPLGLNTFWRHAVYSSALCERLAKAIPKSAEIEPGMAYMSGLLHNFGHLLLGHVYMPGFRLLNRSILANPGIDIMLLEEQLLGMHHGEIGRLLLENWEMPQQAVIACEFHHDPDYSGKFAEYSHLVLLADRLLWGQNIGEASTLQIPEQSLKHTHLSAEVMVDILEPLLEACVDMDKLASQISG